MTGICIEKLPHECGTAKGLQVFADPDTEKVSGFCFSCNTYIHNPYGKEVTLGEIDIPPPKSEEDIQYEMAEIDGYPCVDLPSRKLRATYLDEFGIKVAINEGDGKTPMITYFPMYVEGKLSGYYAKTIGKDSIQWAIGNVKGAEPFGWDRAKGSGAYKLIITEGREDAVAVASIFGRFGDAKYKPAVISLPNGVKSVKSSLSQIENEAKSLFKEIVICFDNDRAGQEAVENAMAIFPKALTVVLPEKDVNDCIIKGASKAAYNALAFHASSPKNTRLVIAGGSLHALAREPTPYGELTWPYPTLNKLMRGIRYGETIYIGAGVKMGKSEQLNDIAAHFIKEHDVKVFMAKPEEDIKKTYKRMCNKMVGAVFDDPDVEFDYELYDKAGEMLDEKLIMLGLYQHMGWESLRRDIVTAANLGAKAVFIDPITNLTAGMNASDTNAKLGEIARDVSALAKDLDIVVFLFAHLKAPDGSITAESRQKKYDKGQYYQLGNCPHERGGTVYSNQFTGSRAMMQACNLMLGLEGNKDPELPEEIRNTRWLTILEDREFGNSDSIRLHRNKYTTLYKEVE